LQFCNNEMHILTTSIPSVTQELIILWHLKDD